MRRAASSNLFLGFVLALLAWPTSPATLSVRGGLDQSWRAALATAVHQGMPFGSRAVFTYGPLSFLVSPQLFYRPTSVASLLFTLVFLTALFAIVLWGLRRSVPLPLALVVAYLVGDFSRISSGYFGNAVAVEDVLALTMVLGVGILSSRWGERPPLWVWVTFGATLAVFGLVKVSLGVALGVLVVIIITCFPTQRPAERVAAVGWTAAGLVPAFACAWFGTGNGFGNLLIFVRSSVAVIAGYGVMGLDVPDRWYSYWLAAFLAVVIGAFAAAHSKDLARRVQVGVGLLTLGTLWFLFKEGFVRHDEHDVVFFVAAPIMLTAFSPRWRSSMWTVSGVLAMTILTTTVAVAVPPELAQPLHSLRNFASQTGTLLSSQRSQAVVAMSRRSMHLAYARAGVSQRMVDLMRGHTVDVSPTEQALVWAYPGLRADPLPVVQDYSAYTPSLDQLDVDALRSKHAPRFILRTPTAIDQRDPAFEPPATQVAIACRYRQVAVDAQWQLLERAGNRCGRLRPIGSVSTGYGHPIRVPTAPRGEAVVATFHLSQGLVSKVVSVLYKPPSTYMAANDGTQLWHFVPATGPDLHMVRPPATLGYARAFAPGTIWSLRFSVSGAGPSSSGVSVRFFALSFRR